MLHAVIMAGGSGTRLWPESRSQRPKQLLPLGGRSSLIQRTIDRLGDLVPLENILISTTEELAPTIADELAFLPRGAVLAEPFPRNTAPCIGLAALFIVRKDPQGTMAVMPADHVIDPAETFVRTLQVAGALVEEDAERLVTFGIPPTYPSPSFGYIERGDPLSGGVITEHPEFADKVFRVARFREKPSIEQARQFLEAGKFSWNAGIFVWKAQTVLDALARHEPEVHERLQAIAEAADSPQFADTLAREFEAMPNISIDYAVMERADHVVVVEAPFQWDDVGGWRALERLHPTDEQGNVVDAERSVVLDTSNTIIRCREAGHVVATLGVENLIVVVTPDATLVADKSREEDVRRIIAELEQRGWREHL